MNDWQYYVELMYQRELDARKFYEIPPIQKQTFYETNLQNLMTHFDDCLEEGEIL
jgi:hypothetical protein